MAGEERCIWVILMLFAMVLAHTYGTRSGADSEIAAYAERLVGDTLKQKRLDNQYLIRTMGTNSFHMYYRDDGSVIGMGTCPK